MDKTAVPQYLLKLALAACTYGVVFYASLYLVPAGGSGASLVWPVAAVGLAILFLFGSDLWPALVLPIFGILLVRGIAPPLAIGVAVGNTLESLAGVYLLQRVGFDPMLSRMRDALGFILISFVSTIISATLITGAVSVFNSAPFNSTLWIGLWIGHTVSLLSFGSFAVRWGCKPLFSRNRREWLEGVPVLGSIVLLNFLIYWTPYGTLGSVSLVFLLIMPLIWAALRTGPRGITLALFAMAFIGATGTLFGWGPLSHSANIDQVLFSTQMVVGTLSLIFLLFTSIVEERKEAVVALESHVGQLEEALQKIRYEDQAKTEFLAILAHELRNPLAPVLSAIELLKLRGPQTLTEKTIDIMDTQVRTLGRLLDDILDISRISRKRFKLQKEVVTLQSAIERSYQTVQSFIQKRNQTLEVEVPQESVWLSADPVRLEQIFGNILYNAAKYTQNGGHISLQAHTHGSSVRVHIKDNGIGIAPNMLEKIFEPFVQGSAEARVGTGLGIGLSLTRKLVELHGGSVVGKSEGLGRGSEFIVELPIPARVQLPIEKTVQQRFPAPTTAGKRILVVDDNEPAARGLASLLEHQGHETLVAVDGPQALKIAHETPPTVAILDLGLPGMDGFEVARALRAEHGEGLKLIAVTGYGQDDDRHRTTAGGFSHHLTKPVSIAQLQEVLDELGKHH